MKIGQGRFFPKFPKLGKLPNVTRTRHAGPKTIHVLVFLWRIVIAAIASIGYCDAFPDVHMKPISCAVYEL